ncbi:MAG: ATP-binding protein [Caldimicrobium sp.]
MNLKKFIHSLAFKLYLAILGKIFLTSLSVGYVIYKGQERALHFEFQKKGIYLSKFLSEQLIEPLLYEEKLTIYKVLETAFNSEPGLILFSEVYNLQGEPLITISKDKVIHNLSPSYLSRLKNLEIKGYPDHYEFISPLIAKNFGPVGFIRLGISYKNLEEQLKSIKKRAFLLVILITITGVFAALFIVHKIIKPAQESLLRAEKLSTLGQFAAGLAHEIKNPLTSIKMLLQGSMENNIPLERADLEIMEKEIERIDKIVKDFLSFARVNKKSWLPIDLKELFNEIESLCRKEFERAGLDFKVETSGDNLNLMGDPDGIKQVLFNLLLNSYQALNGKPGRISLRAEKTEKKIKIIVEDNGEGIPQEIIPKIFDPFFTTKPEGTGMGLAVVNSIVREHKGEIKVFSEVGKGTKIEIILPLKEVA